MVGGPDERRWCNDLPSTDVRLPGVDVVQRTAKQGVAAVGHLDQSAALHLRRQWGVGVALPEAEIALLRSGRERREKAQRTPRLLDVGGVIVGNVGVRLFLARASGIRDEAKPRERGSNPEGPKVINCSVGVSDLTSQSAAIVSGQ